MGLSSTVADRRNAKARDVPSDARNHSDPVGRIRFSHLTPGRIQKFRALAEQLYWSESYSELLTLVERHLIELFRIYEGRFTLVKLRRQLRSSSGQGIDWSPVDRLRRYLRGDSQLAPKKTKTYGLGQVRKLGISVIRSLTSGVVTILPDNKEAEATAREIVRGIFLSPRFVAALARTRPYLGLEIIQQAAHCREGFEFVDLYLTALMRDTQSVFYFELRNNQNCSAHRYFVSDSNRLLYFFLSNVNVAEDNRIYKPIGDFTIAHLHEIGRDHEADPYNLAMTDFEEVGAWQAPLFAAIRFFDIMVKEALFQNIQWHMWLYYLPLFVERIVQNYRLVDPEDDTILEWPNRYSYLLYELFSTMRDWVMGVEDVPEDQTNVVLKSRGTQNENGNIPKSSILALGRSSRHVLESDHIKDVQKRYLMDMVFNLYFDLKESGFEGYATVVLATLSRSGFYSPRSDPKYRAALIRAFEAEKTEYLIKGDEADVDELEAAVNSAGSV